MSIGTLVASRTGTFFYGFSVLFNPIVNEFGWSRVSVSFAFSLRSEVGGIAAPVVGFLVDRVGPRRLMVFGVVAVAVGFFLLRHSDIRTTLRYLHLVPEQLQEKMRLFSPLAGVAEERRRMVPARLRRVK